MSYLIIVILLVVATIKYWYIAIPLWVVATYMQIKAAESRGVGFWESVFTDNDNSETPTRTIHIEEDKPSRRKAIPSAVKREVWRRDNGMCVECGSKENLEYDHIIPVSKGGANTARNIQLLCETCNRSKGAKIQ